MTSLPDNEYVLFPISGSTRKRLMQVVGVCFIVGAIIGIVGGNASLVASSKSATTGKWIASVFVVVVLFIHMNDLKATKGMMESQLSKLPLIRQRFLDRHSGFRNATVFAFYLLCVVPFLWFVIACGANGTILLGSLPTSGQQSTVKMLITRSVGHGGSQRSGCSNRVYVEGPLMFNTICRVPEQVRRHLKKGDTIIAHGTANSWGMRVSSIQAMP